MRPGLGTESGAGGDEPLGSRATPQRQETKPDFPARHQPTGGKAASIKVLFKAAKSLLSRKAEPKPQPRRRRRGESDRGFRAAWRTMLRKTSAAARGRYATLRPAPKAQKPVAPEPIASEPTAPANAYDSAAMYLADTLEWLNLWQENADNDNWNEEEFSARQDQDFPQP